MIHCIIWSKSLSLLWSRVKGSNDFSLMNQFLLFLKIMTIVIRWTLIFISPKQMSYSGIAESFFHFICINTLKPCFNIPLLILRMILFIIKFLLVLKFRMMAKYKDTYINFCFPPATNALGWMDKSVFYFWYNCVYLNLSL